MSKQGEAVRALIEAERNGVLSTLSKKHPGWPFGSITPYALTDAGEPIIYISEIAEHTRNLRADARVSLIIQDAKAARDPQAGARVTLMGYCMPVTAPYLEDGGRRYQQRFPTSAGFSATHDFTLFQINVSSARFIGGFGEIYWLERAEFIAPAASSLDPLAPHAEMICNHMNEDHADALRLYAAAFAETPAESARMIHVDSAGFDLMAIQEDRHKHVRIDFAAPVTTTAEARAALVEMVKRARQAG
jgi:putative heme iron utilization protein